jgi:hypothetical protein
MTGYPGDKNIEELGFNISRSVLSNLSPKSLYPELPICHSDESGF